MKYKKITILLDELPKDASYVSQEVVSAFQRRLSSAMEKVDEEFRERQKVKSERKGYISLG